MQRQHRNPNSGIAFVCWVYNEPGQTATNLIASLLCQLVRQTCEVSDKLASSYDLHRRSNTRPLLAEVSALLHAYLNKLLDAFIVVDALDECIEKDRNDFVAELRTLPSSLRLLITSRGIPSIESKVGKCSRLQIRATHGDLQLFLDAKPKKHDMLREFIDESAGLKEEIVETILLKANGM